MPKGPASPVREGGIYSGLISKDNPNDIIERPPRGVRRPHVYIDLKRSAVVVSCRGGWLVGAARRKMKKIKIEKEEKEEKKTQNTKNTHKKKKTIYYI